MRHSDADSSSGRTPRIKWVRGRIIVRLLADDPFMEGYVEQRYEYSRAMREQAIDAKAVVMETVWKMIQTCEKNAR